MVVDQGSDVKPKDPEAVPGGGRDQFYWPRTLLLPRRGDQDNQCAWVINDVVEAQPHSVPNVDELLVLTHRESVVAMTEGLGVVAVDRR